MDQPEISPLALTDDELGSLYKAVTAADFSRGLDVITNLRADRGDQDGGATPNYALIRAGNRTVGPRPIAEFYWRPDAEAMARIGMRAAFLIESLQTRNKEQDQLVAELKVERERCALVARTAVGDGCTEAERNVAMLISAAILDSK